MSKIYYWEKLTFSKLVGKVNYLERKFEEMHYRWRAIRYKVYSEERLYRHYCLQLSFVYKTVSQISFNLFCLGDKRLLSEFLRKWGWFQGHNERFPKYLGQKLKFQKTETRFCRWESTDNNNINFLLSMGNPFTSLLTKENTWKRIFNSNSELPQNRTQKKLYPK